MMVLPFSYQGPLLLRLGRYFIDEGMGASFFTFSGSGFEVEFIGTSLKANILSSCCDSKDGRAYIAVLIDKQKFMDARVIPLDKEDKTYELAKGLPLAKHRLRVYKLTESSCSYTAFSSIITDGEFLKVNDTYPLKIEFYGDSITAGNGVKGEEGDDNFETRTENAITSYCGLVSESLNADFSIVAIGGFALLSSPWNRQEDVKNIPELFDKADFRWGYPLSSLPSWDNSLFKPDIVVINLGTNDDQYISSISIKEEKEKAKKDFKEALASFIKRIMQTYGDLPIIVVTGMIKNNFTDSLLKEEVEELNLPNVSFLHFSSLKEGGYMANGGHPNQTMHIAASKELEEKIKSVLG